MSVIKKMVCGQKKDPGKYIKIPHDMRFFRQIPQVCLNKFWKILAKCNLQNSDKKLCPRRSKDGLDKNPDPEGESNQGTLDYSPIPS